jgi:hypothetical protein
MPGILQAPRWCYSVYQTVSAKLTGEHRSHRAALICVKGSHMYSIQAHASSLRFVSSEREINYPQAMHQQKRSVRLSTSHDHTLGAFSKYNCKETVTKYITSLCAAWFINDDIVQPRWNRCWKRKRIGTKAIHSKTKCLSSPNP